MSIPFLFNLLFFLAPLTFFPKSSELFEFNKMVLVYGFTIIIAAVWTIECIKAGKLIFMKTVLTVPIAIFLGSQILSTIFSIDRHTSIYGYYGRFSGGLLSLFSYSILYFAFVTFMDKRRTTNLIKTLLVSSAILATYAAFEHFGRSPSCLAITGNFDTNCWVQTVQERVFGTFGQPNWLAAYLVAVIPLAWVNTSPQSPPKVGGEVKGWYILLSVVLFTTLLFTKSRSGLLGFGVAFLVFWLPNIKKHFSAFAFTACYILLATAFIWNPFSPGGSPPVEGVTESGDIRKIVWQGAVDLWRRYPVFGTGTETFAYSYYETRPQAHNNTSEWNYLYNKAHNEYLNFAATTGTVGLAGYLILIIISLSIFFRNKNNLITISLAAGYTSVLVTNFFGFSTVATSLLFFLLPAFAITLNEKTK